MMKTPRVSIVLAFAALLALLVVPAASALPTGEYHIGSCECWKCEGEGSGARCDAPLNCGGPNQYCSAFMAYHCYEEPDFFLSTPTWMGAHALTVPSWAVVR